MNMANHGKQAASGLRDIYKKYESFFNSAAARQRNPSTTTLDKLAKMFNGSYSDARELAKALGDLGVGKYIWGRRGSPSRVEWLYRLDSIGRAALGEDEALIPVSANSEDEEHLDEDGQDETQQASPGYLSHDYQLRLNEKIRLMLPADITKTEADRLAEFIRSLPFERS
jgi:hypothetical protein